MLPTLQKDVGHSSAHLVLINEGESSEAARSYLAGLGIRPTQRYSLSSRDGQTTVSIRVTVRTLGVFRVLEPLLPRMLASA